MPKQTRRRIDGRTKICVTCERDLSARLFLPSQASLDGLEQRCRTCKAWEDKSRSPSLSEIEEYEAHCREIIAEAANLLRTEHPDDTDTTTVDLIAKHRATFEQTVIRLFSLDGWKMPIWVHSSSDADYNPTYG